MNPTGGLIQCNNMNKIKCPYGNGMTKNLKLPYDVEFHFLEQGLNTNNNYQVAVVSITIKQLLINYL